MAKQSVFSKIINWVSPGFNKPATVRRSPNDPNESGPAGSRASISDQIQPNQENKGFGLLVEEMNCDYQIKFCNYVVAANVAAVQVSISVENGDGPKSAALQQKLQKLWEKTVSAMMPSIGFGRVAFEKGWDYDTKNQLTFINKLEAMEYQDSKLKLTEDHKYNGFSVKIKDNPETWEPVLRENSWWLAINATAKNPHGVSHYKGAVEACWRTKCETMKNREVYVRRFAIRGGIAHGPETATDERTGLPYSCAEKMAEAAEAFYSGGMFYLSNKPHEDPRMAEAGKYEWDFSEANAVALDPSPILSVIDKDDVATLRAFGIPEKAAIEGDGAGSYAQLSEQILTLFAMVDNIVGQWVASFQDYVVECSREANYGEGDGPTFTIHAVKLTNRPDSFVITLLTALAANPQFALLLLSGGVDLRSVLEQVGLPVSPEFELIAKQVAARFQAATGGQAGAMPGQPGSTGGDPGTSPEGAVPAEFANFSTLQLNRVFSATSKIQNALIDGTDSETVARIKLKSIGWSPASVDKLIADASDGTIDDPIGLSNPIRLGAYEESKHTRNHGKFASKGTSSLDAAKPRTAPPTPTARTKSEIAKASATRVDSVIQRYAEEHNEPKLAKALGGRAMPDNEPIDVAIHNGDGSIAHGIEMKTMVSNKANKLTMKSDAMARKSAWEKKHKAPIHTVVYDDHSVFNAKGPGMHDESKRKIFYRRGYGSMRINAMHEVTGGHDELKQLLSTPNRKLPVAAQAKKRVPK